MRSNRRTPANWSVAACMLALLALAAGSALAAVPATTAHHFSSHPMISGTVVSVNDHQMVVDTDQGERVTLEVDSRTMAPRDLAPGMVMRVEFLALEDCRFHAQRIMPIRSGMSTNRFQAYANPTAGPGSLAREGTGFGDERTENRAVPAGADHRSDETAMLGEPPTGAVMKSTPTTLNYLSSTRPVISGRVITVNDHLLLIETDQGQRVGLVMDSRTLVPAEIAPGTSMRAEFIAMKDGRYYAQRVSRDRTGTPNREQAYAHTRDSDLVLARNIPDCGFVSATTGTSVTSSMEPRESGAEPATVVAPSAPEPVVEHPETLPETASRQPLLLLLGSLAFLSAGLVAVARGSRN